VSRENQTIAGEVSAAKACEDSLSMALDAFRSSVVGLQARLAAADSELREALAMYASVVDERAALLQRSTQVESFERSCSSKRQALFGEIGDLSRAQVQFRALPGARARSRRSAL